METLGVYFKRHGKGTFISNQWKERQNLLEGYSFTEQMKELVKSLRQRLLLWTVMKRILAPLVGIEAGDSFISIETHSVCRRNSACEGNHILFMMFLKVKTLLEGHSLYDVFEVSSISKSTMLTKNFPGSILSAEEAEALDPHGACLRFRRTTLNHENRIIEYTISVAEAINSSTRHYRINQNFGGGIMFQFSTSQLEALSAEITTREIRQQPELWKEAFDYYKTNLERITAF